MTLLIELKLIVTQSRACPLDYTQRNPLFSGIAAGQYRIAQGEGVALRALFEWG